MASDFNKDDLEVERHYSRNWFTNFVSGRLLQYDLKHHTNYDYRLAQWLVGFANMLRSASPRDGYEWVDRRKSPWSQMDDRQKVREIEASLRADTPVTTAAKSDPETKPKVQKNATRKERQNHGE